MSRSVAPRAPKVRPAYLPADWTAPGLVNAVQALSLGTANEAQQRRALDWIMNEVAGTYDQPYRPGVDGDRETAFACGRMFVGQQIRKVIKLKANIR